VCDPGLSYSYILSEDSFSQIDCDIPCPCVEGGNDGLHGCWLCCLIGRWDGFARVGVGGELVVGGSRRCCRAVDIIEVLLGRIELVGVCCMGAVLECGCDASEASTGDWTITT
jgi:hypothetical protein